MNTLLQFAAGKTGVPGATAWLLSELGESLGKQELFTRQSPERLAALRERAIVESAVSSNRIEGIEIDASRVGTVVFGGSALHDRDEEEVRGYRDGLRLIHQEGAQLPADQDTIRRLHALTRGQIWDAGQYKDKDGDIIERYPDGRSRVRFRTVPAADTPEHMARPEDAWRACLDERWIPPPIALAAFNLDLLCIHPFRDGNGRVSRLMLLLQSYHLGLEVGRYISLERVIEERKERYYETLELSSQGWHEGQHDPWPYVNFVLSVLKDAYRELERRVGQTAEPRGAKSERVTEAVGRMPGSFRIADLRRACPGVSTDTIRRVLGEMRAAGQVECLGRGRDATWRRTANGGTRS